MKNIKIKKFLLRTAIKFAMIFGAFKSTQEIVDFFNHEQIAAYENIIDDFANLMENEGIENPIEIFDYYNYALWNGYLSNDHTYQYDVNRELFISNSGLSCITGRGVCLNKADLLSSIFRKCGYEAYSVNCYVDMEERIMNPIRTNQQFEKSISENSSNENMDKLLTILDPITKLVGNHSITCVEYNGNFYYFDPTNLVYLKKTDLNTVEIINGEGSFELKYLASLFYSDLKSLRVITDTGFDYSKFLNDKSVHIDIEQLEQFYDSESDSYRLISNQLERKNQFILLIISCLLALTTVKKTISGVRIIKDNIINLKDEKVKVKQMTITELKDYN